MSVFSVITAALGSHIKGDLRQPEGLIAIGRDSRIALGAGSACVCVHPSIHDMFSMWRIAG